jgi:hypothetical protein
MAFGVFTGLEGFLPVSLYPMVYVVKICVVTALLLMMRVTLRDIQPRRTFVVPGVLAGLVVFGIWILIEEWLPYRHLGGRIGFDPFAALPDPLLRTAFLVVRFYGLVLLVPVMEELFLRSFALRYVTSDQFARVPIGEYSASAFWAVAALSALSHPEWVAAVMTSIAYTLLLRYTRSLFTIVLAHATTNLALGIYIVAMRSWRYW